MVDAVRTGRDHVDVVDYMSRHRARTEVSDSNGDRELPLIADLHQDHNVSAVLLHKQQNQKGSEIHGGERRGRSLERSLTYAGNVVLACHRVHENENKVEEQSIGLAALRYHACRKNCAENGQWGEYR